MMEPQDNTTSRRLYVDYPWPIWLAGWIAILKGVVWLSSDPNIPQLQLTVLGYKYLALMIPLIVCGIALWNLKRWAAWGLGVLCAADILFFIFFPFAMNALALNRISLVSLIFTFFVFVVNGPVSDILILILLPVFFRYAGKKDESASD